MNRDCCVCNSSNADEFIRQKWKLPFIGSNKIGFAVCRDCGLVYQSTTPSPKNINMYYESAAAYINAGRSGDVSEQKKRFVQRQLYTLFDVLGCVPRNIFQVGCSEGYTLSMFLDSGSSKVAGVDPSIASHKLAKEKYGIDTSIGFFEDYHLTGEVYDLIVLTHVLEHLFDPVGILKKCSLMQNDDGWVLIEVPLFEGCSFFPPGMFTLEHLNYFSENNLKRMVYKIGYEPYFIGKYFYNVDYPVIMMVCQKKTNDNENNRNDYEYNIEIVKEYLRKESLSWKKVEERVRKTIPDGEKVYIYGAGLHTTQLLANTDIEQHVEIVGLLDSSPTKWGKRIGDYECNRPNTVCEGIKYIVISSYASEDEIYEFLVAGYDDLKIVKLYGVMR